MTWSQGGPGQALAGCSSTLQLLWWDWGAVQKESCPERKAQVYKSSLHRLPAGFFVGQGTMPGIRQVPFCSRSPPEAAPSTAQAP